MQLNQSYQMKKLAILIIPLFIFSVVAVSQIEYDVRYTGGIMNISMSNDQGEIIVTQPYAKNVSVYYDTFFKAYLITFTGEKGQKTIKLQYSGENSAYGDPIYLDDIKERHYVISSLPKKLHIMVLTKRVWQADYESLYPNFIITDLKKNQ